MSISQRMNLLDVLHTGTLGNKIESLLQRKDTTAPQTVIKEAANMDKIDLSNPSSLKTADNDMGLSSLQAPMPSLLHRDSLASTTSTSSSGLSSPMSEDTDEEDLSCFDFIDMERHPSLSASSDSLSPSPSPREKCVFSASEKLFSTGEQTKKLPAGTHGTVLLVGVGFVGAHLMERFSSAYEVVAFDVSSKRCEQLRSLHGENRNVTFISDVEADARTSSFDLCLVSVPTLLTPDLSSVDQTHIRAAFDMVYRLARPGSTVVVESSVTVGMTRALFSPLRAKGVFVGFSPERVDPGRTFPAFEDIPKVVSGLDNESLERIVELYSRVFTTVVPVSKPEVAEFTKLYENCQRLINIAYVNEIADACQSHGVDVHEVVMASSTKPFGFTPYTPSLGAGGHCIPVNPFYLLANCDLPLLKSAALANQQRPVAKAQEVKQIAKEAFATRTFASAEERANAKVSVAILGMGFKRGEASLAYAPTVTLADSMQELGLSVHYIDDYVKTDRWGQIEKNVLMETPAALDEMVDVVVVAQKPLAEETRALQRLTRAQVVYFSK
ncbi:nucleotide sugar dehydrogenase [Testicularia cyperi]|uniref:Nucleotide sugar dehydrogenase n=1 Tax=Testicularia cyperi TaxID=1882483 RepID=A0A317XTZ5_9BASI|nr:nucleotide sugar dehydrogenase [Testicularia cyperi]